MPHTIYLIDDLGRPANHSTTIWSARVNDVGQFYQALGLGIARQTANNGQAFLAAQCAGLSLAIVPAAAPSDPNATTLYFGVDSLASAMAAATANRGQLVMQPYQTPMGYQAVVVDPDGRRIFITEIRAAASGPRAFDAPALLEVRSAGVGAAAGTSSRFNEQKEAQALAAVKRGAAVLLAGLVLIVVAVVLFFDFILIVTRPGGMREVDANAATLQMNTVLIIVGLAMLTPIVGKILCGIPATSRVGYGALWTTIGIDLTADALIILNMLAPASGAAGLAKVMYLVGFTSPFFFVYFLGRILAQTRNESVAGFATATNVIYGITLALTIIGTLLTLTNPFFGRTATTLFTLAAGVYGICYIILLIRILCAKSPLATQ